MKVFVSSTKGDLDPDCRPRVIEAINSVEAIPVAMENWPAEYLPALELVLQKIDESTHYVGLFAYRRGWIPPGTTESITEQEFEHARGRLARENIAVFVPQESSEIAMLLRERARQAQDLADGEAQTRFLNRVTSAGAVEFFRDVPDLSIRATRCVASWNTPLLERWIERRRVPPKAPAEEEVAGLGRRAQMDAFETHVVTPLAAGAGTAAAVLVAGPRGYGHDELLRRLQKRYDAASRRMHLYPVGLSPWRRTDLAALLGQVRKATGAAELSTVSAAAAHLGTLLAQKDVVLQMTGLHNFDGGVQGFAGQFWWPLLDALPASTPYRLLCMASYEAAPGAAPALDPAVQPDPGDAFDPRRVTLLPPLEAFTMQELAVFVRRWIDAPDAMPLVAGLMAATGGVPGLLYAALKEPSTWETEA